MEGFLITGGMTLAGGVLVAVFATIADSRIKKREATKLAA